MATSKDPRLSHVDAEGTARMVDVGGKPDTRRSATAEAFVTMRPDTVAAVSEGRMPKGDVFAVARLAGIMAAKRTPDLIPLCHQVALTHVDVDVVPEEAGVRVRATAEANGPTGVEMEALTAVVVASLALYDMCKATERGMVIGEVRLLSKEGGASGEWKREVPK